MSREFAHDFFEMAEFRNCQLAAQLAKAKNEIKRPKEHIASLSGQMLRSATALENGAGAGHEIAALREAAKEDS